MDGPVMFVISSLAGKEKPRTSLNNDRLRKVSIDNSSEIGALVPVRVDTPDVWIIMPPA